MGIKGFFYYIDESGNTGTDWLNEAQPLFVHGGWLVPNSNKVAIENSITKLHSHTQANELKSKNVFKKSKGVDIFAYLQTNMGGNGAVPFFTITDKKFMVAAKIVETFFDHFYNPSLNGYLTFPFELKIALANCIHENISNIALLSFSNLIKNGTITINEMELIKDSLIFLFKNIGHYKVADVLNYSNLVEMIDEFEVVSKDGTKKHTIALTNPGIIKLFNSIEQFVRVYDADVQVYHDKLRGYDSSFRWIKEIFFKQRPPVDFGFGGRTLLSNFPHIKFLEMKDSKDEPIIQASDLLCGFILKLFTKINQNIVLRDKELELLKTFVVLRYSLMEVCAFWVWDHCASYTFEKQFINIAFPELDYEATDYNEIIHNDFYKALK